MDRRLMDALRVVGLEIYQHRTRPQDDEWFCTTPLGDLGPFRSEEWALVEGVRALTRYAAGQRAAADDPPPPFERFLHELEAEQRRRAEG